MRALFIHSGVQVTLFEKDGTRELPAPEGTLSKAPQLCHWDQYPAPNAPGFDTPLREQVANAS
jgi:hypothetical protein